MNVGVFNYLRHGTRHGFSHLGFAFACLIVVVLDEVAERQEWLDSMKQMGKTDQYEPIIRAQISERVAEMRKMDRERAAVHGFDRVPSSSSSSNSLIADGSDRH